jgi:hypothetical protein
MTGGVWVSLFFELDLRGIAAPMAIANRPTKPPAGTGRLSRRPYGPGSKGLGGFLRVVEDLEDTVES